MKKKKEEEFKWTFNQIKDCFSECAHIHFGGPNNFFIDWRDLEESLIAFKEKRPYEEQPLVRSLHEASVEKH